MLWQPRDGYRFSIDPLLLVDFVKPPFGRFVDFCAGCGVVGLGILSRDGQAQATMVELQQRLATLARRNADDNGMGARVEVRHEDLRRAFDHGTKFSLAVANPPYRSLDEGPASPDVEVATAQHELEVKLADVCDAMSRSLVAAGRAALVYPASRVAHLLSTLEGAGLRPLRARFVHPRAAEPANRVLVEAHKGARGPLVVEPPLVLRDGDGYSAEAARLLGDG
ncbi:MAG: tRNA1(Val) (adenine(37)-N6)-methyltransferase [Polyangia bacterium]